jgi:phosphoserine phosphatase
MDLALFDLDNTLIAGDSDFEWAQFLIGKGILDRAPVRSEKYRVLRAIQGGHPRYRCLSGFPVAALVALPARRA